MLVSFSFFYHRLIFSKHGIHLVDENSLLFHKHFLSEKTQSWLTDEILNFHSTSQGYEYVSDLGDCSGKPLIKIRFGRDFAPETPKIIKRTILLHGFYFEWKQNSYLRLSFRANRNVCLHITSDYCLIEDQSGCSFSENWSINDSCFPTYWNATLGCNGGDPAEQGQHRRRSA